MIEHLSIRNFQSLHHVELELAPLTVIVGPSSSGKSALTRAARVLIENQRGNSFISHGERISTITARTSHGTVTLTRGKATDDNSYVVIPNDPGHKLYPQQKWTKLGGETPVEVSEFLGINPKDPIAFASQFDKPYLLDEKPPEVARVLGELTNVRVIFDAARESNRRKLASGSLLKTRASDLDDIKAKIPEYRAIKAQTAALEEAEHLLNGARIDSEAIDELESAIDSLQINQDRVKALKPLTEIVIPDESELIEAYEALMALRRALIEYVEASKVHEAAVERRYLAQLEYDELGEEADRIRVELGSDLEQYIRAHGSLHKGIDGKTDMIAVVQASVLAQKWMEERDS